MIFYLLLFFPPLIFSIIDASNCGLISERFLIRPKRMILGGTEVMEDGFWPWQVSLQKYNETDDRWKWAGCGGTLIGDRWAATAAHCFKKGSIVANYSVMIGSAHASIEDESDEVLIVNRIIRHPTFEEGFTNNDDIALLELEPSALNANPIVPVCIPARDQIVPINIKAVAIGYGVSAAHYFDELATLTTDEKLRQTTLTIHSLMQCGREHELDWRNPPRGVDLGICTGDTDHGTLRGDSGGPLMMKSNDGRWVQIGVNSYGTYKSIDNERSSSDSPVLYGQHATSTTTSRPGPEEEGSGDIPNEEGSGDTQITEHIEEGSGAELLTDKDKVPKDLKEIRYVKDRSSFTKLYAYCDWIEKETGGQVKCLKEELTFQEPPRFSDFTEFN